MARGLMIAASLCFYAFFSWKFVLILLPCAFLTYGIAALADTRSDKRALMAAGILLNLLPLCFFKYMPQEFLKSHSLLMPVGISFYTFSQISYVIDRCRGDAEKRSLPDYLLFVTWFPKLAEGPICRYSEIMPQFDDSRNHRISRENMIRGGLLFLFGMAKKVLIADNLSAAVSYGYAWAHYSDTLTVILTVSAYALQLYYDFSGYCDMAAGIAKMFNIDLPLNFDSPYRAVSFGHFWKKWHMSLTGFFTRYVYIPLGGSRKGRLRAAVNVFVVFILSAIWHGNGVTYLLWGVISAFFLLVNNRFFRDKAERVTSKGGIMALRILTFAVFCFTLVFFGSPDMDHSLALLRALAFPAFPGILYRMADTMKIAELYPLEKLLDLAAPSLVRPFRLFELAGLVLFSAAITMGGRNARELSMTMALNRRNAVLTAILAAWCFVSMSGVSTFLYFQF